jgi:hypothetical protein
MATSEQQQDNKNQENMLLDSVDRISKQAKYVATLFNNTVDGPSSISSNPRTTKRHDNNRNHRNHI